jgi:hypothetical protein
MILEWKFAVQLLDLVVADPTTFETSVEVDWGVLRHLLELHLESAMLWLLL